MKYKIFCAVFALLIFVGSVAATAADESLGVARVHQHLSARQPDEGCDCGGSELCTHLPLVVIETGGQTIPGEPISENGQIVDYTTTETGEAEIVVTIKTIEEDGAWHHPSDEATQTTQALFRIRGNSSRRFPKKSYRLKLVADDAGTEKNPLPLLGMSADDDWALHGPFLDKTLIRNYMWMNISAEVMGYAPNVRFCEVILDGEYQGLYLLMETIKKSDERVNLTDYENGALQTSYLLRMDAIERTFFRGEEDMVALDNYTWYTHRLEFVETEKTGIEVLYPNETVLAEELLDYIQRDVSAFERGLYSSDMLSGLYDYDDVIDVDSFVDYYILQEFLANNDAFSRSTYLYRDVRGKLTLGPVWDYNNVLNNFIRRFGYEGFLLTNRTWISRLMTDEDFVERVIRRYRQLRQGGLSEEYLLSYIDEVIEYLGPAIERNDEVWGYSYDPSVLEYGQYRIPDPGQTLEDVNPGSHEQAVEWMIDYMLTRGRWMDEHIEDLRQYCHPSRTASERVE